MQQTNMVEQLVYPMSVQLIKSSYSRHLKKLMALCATQNSQGWVSTLYSIQARFRLVPDGHRIYYKVSYQVIQKVGGKLGGATYFFGGAKSLLPSRRTATAYGVR